MSASRDGPDGVGYTFGARGGPPRGGGGGPPGPPPRPRDVGRAARSTRELGQAGQSHRRPSEQLLAAQVEGYIHSTPVLASGVHAAVLQQFHGRLGILRCVRAGVGC